METNPNKSKQNPTSPVLFGKPFVADKPHPWLDEKFVFQIRKIFLQNKRQALIRLVKKRYEWMNDFIKEGDKGIEVGCGPGISKLFIHSEGFSITDCVNFDWIDQQVDVLEMPFPDSSLDYIVASNMLHHVAKPAIFFDSCSRVLKDGGLLLIQDVNASTIFRIILSKITRHEGYDFTVNVFNRDKFCCDAKDPWNANNAVPNLLFDNIDAFEKKFPFKIKHKKTTECLAWIITGGMGSVSSYIPLPEPFLKLVDLFDRLLISVAPKQFSMQQQIVLCNSKKICA